MSILPKTPRSRALSFQPSLATHARSAAMERKRAKIAANPARRWFRRGMATLAVTAALVSVFGSAAQANMPWDDAENTITNIMNVCRPNDSPGLSTNNGPNAQTVLPQFPTPTKGGDGLARMTDALVNAKVGAPGGNGLALVTGVKDQGFNRYGYGALQWDNFGSSCFVGPGQLLNGPANAMLTIAVNGPAVLLTAFINFALNNVFYDMFFSMVNPFMELFAQVLSPWVTMIVLVGGTITILIRSKGSLTRILQLGAWMLAILGLFFGIQNEGLGRQITSLANNSVTQATNLIACQVATASTITTNVASSGGGSCGTIASVDVNTSGSSNVGNGSFKLTGGIDQAIWYSIPYQVWSMGAVGSSQYNADHAKDQTGNELSWSAAMLNAKHIATDSVGGEAIKYTEMWNQAGYAGRGTNLEGQKIRLWTEPYNKGWDTTNENGADRTAVWNGVPYLGLVKAICNDVASGTGKSEDSADNKWLYQSNCDSAGANVNFLGAFKGDLFWERGAAITSGAFSIIAVFIPLAAVSLYLMGQKTVFFFILLFAPIFLAIGAFPDEKRMGFAKKYFEFFIANLVKQIVAVCILLFVMTGVSGVLTSNTTAWWFKPIGVVMFTYGLVLFAIPLANILKAAAKGDVSIVEKTLTAPQRAAKGAVKIAGVAAIAAATMGVGALAAGGAAAGAAGAATGSGTMGAAGAAAGRKGLGALVKNGKGLVMAGAGQLKENLKKGGTKGAAESLAHMVKSGEAMRLLRYTGLNGTPVGNMLRDGVGISQLGLKFMGRQDKAEDPATLQGKANARELGIKQLDHADYISGAPKYERDAGGKLTAFGQQEAAADYEKYFTGDPEGDKANHASTQALGNFHRNYEKMTGQKLPTDPEHPSNGGTAPTQQQTAQTITDQIPSSSWQTAVVPNVVREGSSILQAVGGTEALFSGVQTTTTLDKIFESYGTMANIDPTHPTMSTLAQFGFAMKGSDTELQAATFQASMEMIKEHGLPDKIQGINASPEFAENFSPATVLSMAPNLTSSSTLDDRVEAAGLFTVASMAVPAGSLIAPSVDALRDALWNPESQAEHINELKSALANSVAMADVRNPFFSATDASFAMPTSEAQKAPEWTTAQQPAPTPTVEFANVGAPAQAATPVFSAPEVPARAAAPASAPEAAPAAPAAVQPVFSAVAPEREFVQPQYREAPMAPVFVEPTSSAPRHAAPQTNGATVAQVAEQIDLAMAKQRGDIAGIFNETADKVQQQSRDDEAAQDYKLMDSGRVRRSSGLFSVEEDDK